MLTRLKVRNFKRFDDIDIELANPVLFVGPNNSGKTSALQALALWAQGLDQYLSRRGKGEVPSKRPGVVLNRRDITCVPVPNTNLLWRARHVNEVAPGEVGKKKSTVRIKVQIEVEGDGPDQPWTYGLEFDYQNGESVNCRPLKDAEDQYIKPPAGAEGVKLAFLLPMSGLADREFVKHRGEVDFLIGQGRTAEVLRNLCHQLAVERPDAWVKVKARMRDLFGVVLDDPELLADRAEIIMTYRERGASLDLASAGRGMQQTLLLLAYMGVNPGAVLLLDEPDAHLEILRQRQIYQVLTEEARETRSQIIVASHSEVLLNEAADRDTVVAFVGRPHRINDRGSHVIKALRSIGFEHYLQAEQQRWVLFLEGSTDLAVLRSFAGVLGHDAALEALQRPYVHYVENSPQRAREHFHGLREAVPGLSGLALFDRLGGVERLVVSGPLVELAWKRREIESYLCHEDALLAWARDNVPDQPLFASIREQTLRACITEIVEAQRTLKGDGFDPWGGEIKATDEFLDPVFRKYHQRLKLPDLFRKSSYHLLAPYVP